MTSYQSTFWYFLLNSSSCSKVAQKHVLFFRRTCEIWDFSDFLLGICLISNSRWVLFPQLEWCAIWIIKNNQKLSLENQSNLDSKNPADVRFSLKLNKYLKKYSKNLLKLTIISNMNKLSPALWSGDKSTLTRSNTFFYVPYMRESELMKAYVLYMVYNN